MQLQEHQQTLLCAEEIGESAGGAATAQGAKSLERSGCLPED